MNFREQALELSANLIRKKLFLLSALLIFVCGGDLFPQDYKKMRKKQLRIEHQIKLKVIDSLSQELNLSNKENQKI